MAVTDAYQLELRGLLMGPTTRYETDPTGWGGFGVPAPTTADTVLDQARGVFPAPDFGGPLILTFPLQWGGHGPAEAMLDFLDLRTAWAESKVDLELDFWLPGWELCAVLGRPRGLVENLSLIPRGEGSALATFFVPSGEISFLTLGGS